MPALELLVLEGDAMTVELLPGLGGRLHRIRSFGHDLLRTPDRLDTHRDEGFFWGAYPMAPWCNRAPPGPRRIAGRTIDLAPNFPDRTAIHGLVAGIPWERRGPATIGIEVDDGRWPWAFDAELDARVDGAILGLRYRLINRSDAPMPAGLGLHPWFRAPVEVRVPAHGVYRSNAGSSVAPDRVDGPFDLSRRAVPAPDLDGTWTNLDEPVIGLAWPDAGVAARLSVETSAPAVLVAVASPAELGAVAVEPQTHGPDPLRRFAHGERDAPLLLPPDNALTLDLRLEISLARNLR